MKNFFEGKSLREIFFRISFEFSFLREKGKEKNFF